MKIVILGLSITSSWGNGHATTWRGLVRELAARGHEVLFLERDVPWYARHRDLPDPPFCRLGLYPGLDALADWTDEVRAADAVIIGSYVPDGVAVGRWAQRVATGPVAFYDIDTPVTLAKLARGDEEYLAPSQIADYDIYLSFTGGPTLRRLEQEFGSPAARALYCSADTQVYRPVPAETRWDLSYLGTWSEDRQPTLDRLLVAAARALPHCRFVVAGPNYPDSIQWPANVERIDHVGPGDHAAFYAASRFTLNVTRADMVAAGHSPSIRLFEAAACGTPIISDIWDGLDELFTPGAEIVLARTTTDVIAALAMDATQARAMGEAARTRVLAAHTAAHRAEALERELIAAQTRRAEGRHRRLRRFSGQRMLVAGGAGFLGSHLTERLLAEGAEVVVLDNLQTGSLDNLDAALKHPACEFIEADITDPLPRRLALGRFDRIWNLACAASPPLYQADPEHTLLTSVMGTKHLLDLAQRTGARLLLSSTSEIYGDPDQHPQPESYLGNVNCTGPRACYDEGKRCAETLCFDYDRAGRGEVRVARIFNTYGPRLSAADGRVVSNLIAQALAGEDITIYGDGSQTRSFCYVDDLVEGLIALMEHEGPQPGPVNLGNPAEMTVADLADLVLSLTGSASRIVHRPLPTDDPRRRRPDIDKAWELLCWQPATGLEDGLRATIAWFRAEAARGRQKRADSVAALTA